MSIYDVSKSDSDGRGVSRALTSLASQVRANRRISSAGDVPDPTPEPAIVDPSSLILLAIQEGTRR